jgi:hypothetical protein
LSTDVSKLLQNAAGIFAQLATAYENDKKRNEDRLAHIEMTTHENREALRVAAEAILERLK